MKFLRLLRHPAALCLALAGLAFFNLLPPDALAAVAIIGSTSVSTAFVANYNSVVKHAFQRGATKCINMVRHSTDVVGSTETFQKIGKGTAVTKARHAQITPMNVDHSTATATLEDFYAGDWVDKLDETKIKHDERDAMAFAGAAALGRKVDDQIFTAMDGTTNDVTLTLTNYATIRNSLLDVMETLWESDVPDDGQIYIALSPHAWSAALLVEQFSSSRYVPDLPWMKGMEMRKWLGGIWFMHNGVPGRGTSACKSYAWHKTAIGYASAANALNVPGYGSQRADITWHGDRAAHFINHMMSGGAVAIDATGVVEIDVNDTTALPTS